MALTVPMNPEYLPEAALLIAGTFAGAGALYLLFQRRSRQAILAVGGSVTCIALALLMARTLHRQAGEPGLLPAAENSMSLVLGDVIVRVPPADGYVLSVDGRQFLELDLHRGLAVSCVVGANNRAVTGITKNTLPFRWADARLSSPDPHTLVVQEGGKGIFEARYSESRRIEVTGEFFDRNAAEAALISFENGISWNGGRVPPGTVIDLRKQGKGMIDFGPSGSVRIRPTVLQAQ